jgi:hypothetical protein
MKVTMALRHERAIKAAAAQVDTASVAMAIRPVPSEFPAGEAVGEDDVIALVDRARNGEPDAFASTTATSTVSIASCCTA